MAKTPDRESLSDQAGNEKRPQRCFAAALVVLALD
jgi:hypothetical protein